MDLHVGPGGATQPAARSAELVPSALPVTRLALLNLAFGLVGFLYLLDHAAQLGAMMRQPFLKSPLFAYLVLLGFSGISALGGLLIQSQLRALPGTRGRGRMILAFASAIVVPVLLAVSVIAAAFARPG